MTIVSARRYLSTPVVAESDLFVFAASATVTLISCFDPAAGVLTVKMEFVVR